MNYYKFTDGERTGFRATRRSYAAGSFSSYGISFSSYLDFGGNPAVAIDKAEYDALNNLKAARLAGYTGLISASDSWVWNKDIDATLDRLETTIGQLQEIIAEASKPEVLEADLVAAEAPLPAPVPTIHSNREAWLVALVEALRPTFAKHGSPLPAKLRVSCSFPSRGGIKAAGKATTIGQCWYPQNSADGTTEVFVSPTQADPMIVAEILVHELVHAALGPGHGHGKVFKRLALLVGLEGPMTATSAGSRLKTDLAPMLRALGPYPHASLDATAAEKKQTTRLIKVTCPYCDYSVRITRKWLDEAGGPLCPVHQDPMEE